MSLDKSQRAVIVLSELNEDIGNQRYLYSIIEESGCQYSERYLKDEYGIYEALYDELATKDHLISSIKKIGSMANIKAIDLIVMLHGKEDELKFHDGWYRTPDLSSTIGSISGSNIQAKLRMVYSTACYGASHNDDFLSAGFNAAIGAKGINASSAYEFPKLLKCWTRDKDTLENALEAADNRAARIASDKAATAYAHIFRLSWADSVNSKKVLDGDGNIWIGSVDNSLRSLLIDRAHYQFKCLGNVEGSRWLDARPQDGSVGLAPVTGTNWQVFEVEPGVYQFKSREDAEGNRWLDGRTQDGKVGLAPATANAGYTGTNWQVFEVEPGVYQFKCLGHIEGNRWLDGQTQNGKVGLVSAPGGYTGTRWQAVKIVE